MGDCTTGESGDSTDLEHIRRQSAPFLADSPLRIQRPLDLERTLTNATAIAPFLEQNMRVYRALDTAERSVVVEFTEQFCANTEFFIAPSLSYGFQIAWCVGANAALVGAAQQTNYFESVEWVYLCDEEDLDVAGDALGYSTVRLDAHACLDESRHLIPGQNLIVHEFAHILDHLLTIVGNHDELSLSFERALDRLEDGVEDPLLTGWYEDLRTTTEANELEFFAYTSEAFFTAPNALRQLYPELTDLYVGIYGLDMPTRLQKL